MAHIGLTGGGHLIAMGSRLGLCHEATLGGSWDLVTACNWAELCKAK